MGNCSTSLKNKYLTNFCAKKFDRHQVSGDACQVERRRPEIVRFLRVKSGIDEHLHQRRVALVGRPVQGRVAVHVGHVGLGAAAEEVGGHQASAEHAGHHQGRQSFVVSCVNGYAGLERRTLVLHPAKKVLK